MNYQMKRDDFQNHLHIVSREILSEYKLPSNKSIVYKIEIDLEKDKKHNSRDELICRSGLFDFTDKQNVFTESEVTRLFCGPSNIKYPEIFPHGNLPQTPSNAVRSECKKKIC